MGDYAKIGGGARRVGGEKNGCPFGPRTSWDLEQGVISQYHVH